MGMSLPLSNKALNPERGDIASALGEEIVYYRAGGSRSNIAKKLPSFMRNRMRKLLSAFSVRIRWEIV